MKAMLFGAVALALAAPAAAFWTEDVWQALDRPFLYYGEAQLTESEKGPPVTAKVPLASLTTLEALRAEHERRLSAAVMTPTAETIRDYLEVNAFVNDKAARFAAGWRALHPTVNAASTALARDDERRTLEVAAGLGRDWGLILFADASPLTRLMLPITERFAATLGLELVVARVGEGPALAKNDPLTVKPDAAPPRGSRRIDGVSGVGTGEPRRPRSHEGAVDGDRRRRRRGIDASSGAVDGLRSPGGASGAPRGV